MIDFFPKSVAARFQNQISIDFDAHPARAVFFRRANKDRAVAAADVIDDVARAHPRHLQHALDLLRREPTAPSFVAVVEAHRLEGGLPATIGREPCEPADAVQHGERIRDEVNLGKTVRTSVKRAFASAFRTNLAGNTVTLAAAVILYFLAVGPVRGFALMLGMATVLDIIILYFFTRPAVTLMSNTKLLQRRTVRASAPAAAGGAR